MLALLELVVLIVLAAAGVDGGIFVVTELNITATVRTPVAPPIVGYTVDGLGRMLAFEPVQLTATPLAAGGSVKGRTPQIQFVSSNASGYFTFDNFIVQTCVADNESFVINFNTSSEMSNFSVFATVFPNVNFLQIVPVEFPNSVAVGSVIPRIEFAVLSSCGSVLTHVPSNGVMSLRSSIISGKMAAPLVGNYSPSSSSSTPQARALVSVGAVFKNIAVDQLRNAGGVILTWIVIDVAVSSSDASAGFGSFNLNVTPALAAQNVRVVFWMTSLAPDQQRSALTGAIAQAYSDLISNVTLSPFEQMDVVADFTSSRHSKVTIPGLAVTPMFLVFILNCSAEGDAPQEYIQAKTNVENAVLAADGKLLISTINSVDVNPRGMLFALTQPDFLAPVVNYNISTVSPIGNVSSRSYVLSIQMGPQSGLGAEVGDTVIVSLTPFFLDSLYIPVPDRYFQFYVSPDQKSALEQARSVMSLAAIVNPDIAFISTLIVQLDCSIGESGSLDFAIHPLQFGLGSNQLERFRRSAQACNIIIILFTSLFSIIAWLTLSPEKRTLVVPHIPLWVARVLYPGTVYVSFSILHSAVDGIDYTLFLVGGAVFAVGLPALCAKLVLLLTPKYQRMDKFSPRQSCVYKIMAPLGEYEVRNTDHISFRYLFNELQGTKYRKIFFVVDYLVWLSTPIVSALLPCDSRHLYVLICVAGHLMIVVGSAPYITISLNALHVLAGGVKCTALVYLFWPGQGTAFRNILSALICVLSPLSIILFIVRNVLPWVVIHLRGSTGVEEWKHLHTKPDQSLALLLSELDVFKVDPGADDVETEEPMMGVGEAANTKDDSVTAQSWSVAEGDEQGDGSVNLHSSFASDSNIINNNSSFASYHSNPPIRPHHQLSPQFELPQTPQHYPSAHSRRPVTTIAEANEHWRALRLQRAAAIAAMEREARAASLQHARNGTTAAAQEAPDPSHRVYYSPVDKKFVEVPFQQPTKEQLAEMNIHETIDEDGNLVLPVRDAHGIPPSRGSNDDFAGRRSIQTKLVEGSFLHKRFIELQQQREVFGHRISN